MSSKRPSVMKSTAKAGAGGAIVIAALLVLMFFQGGGGPAGPETETTSGVSQPNLVTTETTPSPIGSAATPTDSSDSSDSTGGLTPDEQSALSDKVLAILVDERSYLMEVPTEAGPVYRPTDLDRLLELAKLAEGDSNGIRVRILHRESARLSAEHSLKTRLAEIGIGSDAVYMPAEFIP